MVWNDGEFTRSRDDLLARTVRRGELLRRRRRLGWMAVAPLALLLIAVPAALRLSGEDRGTTVAASGGGGGQPSSTTAAPTTVPAPTLPLPSLPATSSSTTPPVRLPTTTQPPPATTVPPPPPITSTTSTTVDDGRPPGPVCEASMFEASLTLDKPSYRPGETVRGTATFRNISGQTCYWASVTSGTDVLDAAGTPLTRGTRVIADAFRWTPLAAGESQASSATWDQQDCRGLPSGPCPQAPPGTYTVVRASAPFGSARATVQLVAA